MPMTSETRRAAFHDDQGREWVVTFDPRRLATPFARETAARFVAMARHNAAQISELINTPEYVGSFVAMTFQIPLRDMDPGLRAFLDRLDHSNFRPAAEALATAIEAAADDPKASENIEAALATLRGEFRPPLRAVSGNQPPVIQAVPPSFFDPIQMGM